MEENTAKQAATEKTFTEEDVNRIVTDRLHRERQKYEGIDLDALKEKAAKFDEMEEASKSELQKANEKAAELEKLTYAEDFWNDQENSSKILQQVKQLKDKIEAYEKLAQRLEDAITLAEMAIEENDESCVDEVQNELAEIVKTEERMR